MRTSLGTPLFVCHANCSRSVLASYLYQDLCRPDRAWSAGLEAGERTSDHALAMLAHWGIDATDHRPAQLDRARCEGAGAIFVMAAPYLRRLLLEYGHDLARKAYLYIDPFHPPERLGPTYTVRPSTTRRPTSWCGDSPGCGRERWRSRRRCVAAAGR